MQVAEKLPEKYLAATPLCNWNHRDIRRKTQEITAGASSPAEKARQIFYFVRDNIRFSLAYSRSTACQTLHKGYGECGTKTNLQVALLRAAGIPARYHWAAARREILAGLVAEFVYRQLPPTVSHFWCECWLHGRWLACEALLDRPLYEGMLQAGLVSRAEIPTIDWDGQTELVLLRSWLTRDRGTLPTYEAVLDGLQTSEEGMPPLWLERLIAPFFYPFNLRYTEKLRRLGPVRQ